KDFEVNIHNSYVIDIVKLILKEIKEKRDEIQEPELTKVYDKLIDEKLKSHHRDYSKLEEYEEEIKKEKERAFGLGPYHVVRHPINLASCLIALSLPLILGSVWAFIPAGIVIILTIVHAVISENHRFNKYEWYYEYTKEVPYMMIPVIW
ncbi:MAG: hypothetical protein KAQ68_03475, partial [Clostridiales bacterium]|nr:hypothetical protein [Clostridiales bacterium]